MKVSKPSGAIALIESSQGILVCLTRDDLNSPGTCRNFASALFTMGIRKVPDGFSFSGSFANSSRPPVPSWRSVMGHYGKRHDFLCACGPGELHGLFFCFLTGDHDLAGRIVVAGATIPFLAASWQVFSVLPLHAEDGGHKPRAAGHGFLHMPAALPHESDRVFELEPPAAVIAVYSPRLWPAAALLSGLFAQGDAARRCLPPGWRAACFP